MPSLGRPAVAELTMRAPRVAVVVDGAREDHCRAFARFACDYPGGIRFLPVPTTRSEIWSDWRGLLRVYDPDIMGDFLSLPLERRNAAASDVTPAYWLSLSVGPEAESAQLALAQWNLQPARFWRTGGHYAFTWPPDPVSVPSYRLHIYACYGNTRAPEGGLIDRTAPERDALLTVFEHADELDFLWGRSGRRPKPTPLEATDVLLSPVLAAPPAAGRVVVVSEAESVQDFLLYWSLRAISPRLGFVGWQLASDLLAGRPGRAWRSLSTARWLRVSEEWRAEHPVPLLLVSASIQPDRLTELACELEAKAVENADPLFSDGTSPSGELPKGALVRAHTESLASLWPSRISWRGEQEPRALVFHGDRALCDLAFPDENVNQYSSGRVVVEFKADGLPIGSGRTSTNLYTEEVARLTPDSLAIFVQPKAHTVQVRFPRTEELIADHLRSRGLDVRFERKHRLAQRLVDRYGVPSLADRLASLPACLLLHNMAKRERSAPRAAYDARSAAHQHSDLMRMVGEAGCADPLSLLEVLTESGALQRGFNASCQECDTGFFVELSGLDESACCPVCRGKSLIPLDAQWRYRLAPLVSEAVTEGVLLHALAVFALRRHLPGLAAIPGAGITQRHREVDVVGFWSGRVVVCECTEGGQSLSVQKLDAHAQLSRDLGAWRLYEVTLGRFPNEIREAAAQPQRDPPVILLEPDSLFAPGGSDEEHQSTV